MLSFEKPIVSRGEVLAQKEVLVLRVVVEGMKLGQDQQAFHDHSLQSCLAVRELVTTRKTGARVRIGSRGKHAVVQIPRLAAHMCAGGVQPRHARCARVPEIDGERWLARENVAEMPKRRLQVAIESVTRNAQAHRVAGEPIA